MSDILQEKWMKGVAITTTCLAVVTAIVSARSVTCVSRIQILTAQEGSQWAYYQAKSIKHNMAEAQLTDFSLRLVGAVPSESTEAVKKAVAKLQGEVERYAKEKEEIKRNAEDIGRKNLRVQRQNNLFVVSVALFQIAIMLSSVSALIKRPWVWIIGLVFGVIALFFFADGFLLFLPLPFLF